jgi:glycosyltransferase 2 family protein
VAVGADLKPSVHLLQNLRAGTSACNIGVASVCHPWRGESGAAGFGGGRQMQILARLGGQVRGVVARIGWSRAGAAGSLILVAAALITLCGMLRDIGFDAVLAAIRATPPFAVLAACGLVFIGYGTVTFYDYFALRAIGRHEVPYGVAAFAGFTASAIGNGLGVGLLTGGAVRLRIYAPWGLGLIEVMKIGFITGLTFWLGNVSALGLALTLAPEQAAAATNLPPWANQAAGLLVLIGVAGYIAWLLRGTRAIGVNSFRLILPDAALTFLQIGIGLLDLAVGSLATYVLLPAAPSTDYLTIAVVYVMAALFGFLCHAPASLGAFEVAMLVLLPQYQKEALLGSLLILHFLYLVLPLGLALVALFLREARAGKAGALAELR